MDSTDDKKDKGAAENSAAGDASESFRPSERLAPDSPLVAPNSNEMELLRQCGLFFWRGGNRRDQKRILDASKSRREKLDCDPAQYLAVLRNSPKEWDELWNLAPARNGQIFFWFPAQFEVLSQMLQERAVTAAERKLELLSVGCGRGYEPYSLAMAMAGTNLTGKGWNITIDAMDNCEMELEKARAADFAAEDLRWLSPEAARRWFVLRAAGRHFKRELGPPVNFHKLNLAEADADELAGVKEKYDVVFCRGLTFACPDDLTLRFGSAIVSLLAPEGLLFLAPGEFLPELNGVRAEERAGVVYYRKIVAAGSPKANVFHVPKRETRRKTANPRPVSKPEPVVGDAFGRRETLLSSFQDKLAEDPDEARDIVLEMLSDELEAGGLSVEALRLMAAVEGVLDRQERKRTIDDFLARWAD
ncbi:MAG: hypothetical protein LBJ64_07290 [Deltaproteobacteria bacterium]|jgi:chemotaxis methyl-accepting protein methylase|nr:hypothetical protein [Deltaproteobacteria bacterium]